MGSLEKFFERLVLGSLKTGATPFVGQYLKL